MAAQGHLLADVGLGAGARCVAWCPVNGIVAVGCRVRHDLACVHLLNVHCVSRKVTLYVPLQGEADDLVAVAWSPAGCRRVLLTATLCGKLSAWTQQPPEPSSHVRITVEDWWCHDVADLAAATAAAQPSDPAAAEAAKTSSSAADGSSSSSSSQLVSVRWLQPVSPWMWNSSAVQQADYTTGSMHGMFAQPSLAGSIANPAACKPDPAATNDAAASGAADSTTPPPAAAAGDEPGTSKNIVSSSSTEEFHWVRTGTLAVAAVMSCGAVVLAWAQWSAYGQLSWVTTSGMSLPTPAGLAGKVQVATADATVCTGGVAVAYALQQQPGTVFVAQLQGNPMHAQFALMEPNSQPLQLPVVQAGSHNLTQQGRCITAVSWDQCSNSSRLACVSADPSGTAADAAAAAGSNSSATLTLLNVQQGQLQQQAQVPCAAAATSQQLVWLLDGLLLWSGGCNMQVFSLDSLQEAAVHFAAPAGKFRAAAPPAAAATGAESSSGSRSLCALAASPHGVAVAAVMHLPSTARGSSSSRLLLYNVPPAESTPSSSGSEAVPVSPKPVAARLLWALMQQQHSWDVVQHTLCAARVPASSADVKGTPSNSSNAAAAAAAAPVQPEAVGRVLALVDSKLAVQQPTLKTTFSARWDVLKLAVLSGTPGDVARVVGIDLRLRIISHMLKPVFDVMREDAGARQREQQRPRLSGLLPLHTYLGDLMTFHIACLKTWIARRAGSSSGLPQHVPCMRHFLDWRPCNLLLLLYMITCQATSASPTAKQDDPLYPTLKQAFKAAPSYKDAAWEQVARGLFPGELQLHYSETIPECLSGLLLPPDEFMKAMETSAQWRQQQPLSDAEITATATRLGLLPVRPPKAAGMFRRELQLHEGFRLQQLDPALGLLPGASASDQGFAGTAAAVGTAADVGPSAVSAAAQGGASGSRVVSMKRRRWEQQISDAMGDTLGPGGSSSSSDSSIISLAQLADVDASMPGLLVSVDGAVVAPEGAAPLAVDDGSKSIPKLIVDQCANGWMYACPITGEMWIRSVT